MLHVILLILKILGIILLSILCLVLLILMAVLFIAVSYRVRIQKGDAIHVTASVGWLFRGVTVNYSLDKAEQLKQDLRICLFGIPIMKPLEQKDTKKPEKEKSGKEKKKKKTVSKSEAPVVETIPESEKISPEETVSETKEKPISERISESVQAEETQSKKKKKVSVWRKIRQMFRKIDLVIENLRNKIKNIQDTIHGLLDKKDKYLGFWNREEHGRARGALWKEVVYLLKKIRPNRVEGKILFGFEDPSATGKCLGAASVLYAWYPKKFELVPDFEREVLECDVWIKGRMRLYIFICILWRLFFNKDVRQMYHNWKQL